MNYENLRKEIEKHNHLYYDLSAPEISDSEYDELYLQLESMEKAQGWVHPDSPTIKLGGTAGKVKHEYKLYSLKKVYNPEEVDPVFDVETPKIDGSNLTITFKNGKFFMALIRGDGEMADSVNHLVPNIKGIPMDIPIKDDKVVVTGECVTDNDVSNFRNYVSGALGLKDPEEIKDRNIRFIVHDWLGKSLNYVNRMDILAKAGFDTVLDKEFCSNYPQDGIVYRLNDYKQCQELGYTDKYPRFAVALKERAKETAESILQKVVWQVGRTGVVTPVGIIDPVILDDATVTRATLHNLDYILSHNLGLGDIIEVERAGGVIPKFIRVVKPSPLNQKITKKSAEEHIGGETRKEGPRLYVKDPSQHGTVKLLHHFVKTMGIKGLGPKSMEKLNLSHPTDLYKNQPWESLGANGKKIIAELERSKTKPYYVVLAALGINGIGLAAAKKIVEYIPSFDRLHEIEYLDIKGVGPATVNNILTWLDTNKEWAEKLPLQLKQEVIEKEEEVTETSTNSLKYCISGKLDMTKSQLSEHLSKYGWVELKGVTKDCNLLISDGTSSIKYTKAEQYGIPIVDYWTHKSKLLNGQIEEIL